LFLFDIFTLVIGNTTTKPKINSLFKKMTKSISKILILFFTIFSFGQTNNNSKLIELGKTYNDFMFRNTPTKDILKEINSNIPENLKTTSSFIVESITSKNKLLTQPFLQRPDDVTLKQIYIVREINFNLQEENQIDNNKLIDSLSNVNIPTYELVDNYYDMLFTSVGNKNQPFDFSKIDFKLKDYNFKDETEQGIFYLIGMKYCNTVIWGYMNIVKPANTKKALEHIKKYPKFNGLPYYQYHDFYFKDFEMIINTENGLQSYKSYYLDKYFETLIFHFICLKKENKSEKEINDLLLGSILKEHNLYKYTSYKETLEEVFKVQKTE